MSVLPKLVWLIGTCKKGGKPDTREMCEAGFVPVLFQTLEEALDEVDPRLPVESVVILPSCSGNALDFTTALRQAWPRVNVCVAACQDNCRAPGMLACALATADQN